MLSPGQALAEARRLITAEGYTYAQAAEATGIPLSTLQKKGAAGAWRSQRDASTSYADTVRGLKAATLSRLARLAEDEDADVGSLTQAIHAWTNLEKTFPEHRYSPTELDPRVKLGVALEVLELFVAYFTETDTNILALLQSHIRPLAARIEAAYAA